MEIMKCPAPYSDTQNTLKKVSKKYLPTAGFTIVELLVVVVVIGILAAITIVSYNGITNRAVESSMQSDLQNSATTLALEQTQSGSYPSDPSSLNNGRGLPASGDNSLSYSSEGSEYCVTVTSPRTSKTFFITSTTGQVNTGSCTDAGNTWTARSMPTNSWSKIAFGNGIFLAAGGGSVVSTEASPTGSTSPNGSTWSTPFNIGSGSAVTPFPFYGNGKFVTYFNTGRVKSATSSNNGSTWQNATPGGTITDYQGVSVAYGNGVYVTTVNTPPETYTRVYTSTDGINWTSQVTPIAWNGWPSVTFANGKFVAVANTGSNQSMTSTDGVNWTLGSPTPSGTWSSVTYGNGKFVAVASGGTNRVMTSTDGVSWTARTAAEANSWSSVTYGTGKFVAVASTGTNRVMTSTDGITWTARAAAEANPWTSVAYGNGCFVAVASTGTNRAMTSCW